MSLKSGRLLLISGMLNGFAWPLPRCTTGIENKIDYQPQKLGAIAPRYEPSPGRPQRGKRRRQWR